MRLRFRSVTYTFGSGTPGLDRHFHELRETMLRPTHQYALLQPTAHWRPPMDIHETPDAIQVKVELAGVREDDVEITLYENALVVAGQRHDDGEHSEHVAFHEAQVRYGPFRADVLLTTAIDRDAVEATYQDGFLRVRLPKLTSAHRDAMPDPRAQRSPSTMGIPPRYNAGPAGAEMPPGQIVPTRRIPTTARTLSRGDA